MKYRVAIDLPGLDVAPAIEADGPAIAASAYVQERDLRAGTYLVQEVPEPQEVEVTITTTVEAKLLHQGGPPATTEEVQS